MTKTFLHWAPRIISLFFVVFISLFALDVFGQGYGVGELLFALFMHLLPSIVLLIVIAIAWKYELVGAAAFLGFAVWYVWTAGLDRPWSWYAFIAGPALIVSLLFFFSWLYKRKKQKLSS